MDPPMAPIATTANELQSYNNDDGARLQAAAAAATATADSQEESSQPQNVIGIGRKRKASSTPGSRGVANLTPEQLAKKRANDREAQRAIRERTRNNIESLERRIRELESQQPFQELQRVIQERDRALVECEDLRRRLGAVAGIVGAQHPGLSGTFTLQSLMDMPSLTQNNAELAALTAQQSPLSPATQSQHPNPQHLHPDLRPPQSSTVQPNPSNQAAYQAGEGTLRKWSPSLEHPPNAASPPLGNGVHTSNIGERLGVNFLLEPSNRQQPPNNPTRGSGQYSQRADDLPLYQRVSLHGDASCPLDYLLLDFHASRRKMLRDGASRLEAIGPEYPAFAAMLDPKGRSETHPVSALLINILSKFPDISTLPEKIAVLYIMFLVMRWLICPCKGCYERLPVWCRPVPEQLERLHVAWCDYLPWPHMRRTIIMNERSIKFDDFFVPYCMTLALNWPLPHDCVLLSTPSENGSNSVTINPAFEHHLRNLENWSLGNEFRKSFPELVDCTVRIKEA